MKRNIYQPKVSPITLSGITVSKMVLQSLFFCIPVLLMAPGVIHAKHFAPRTPLSTCGMTVAVNANPSPACVGNVLTLTATVSGGVAPYSYAWVGPVSADFSQTVTTATTTTPPLTIDDGGFYYVTVTDANGCTANGLALVSVYSNPVLDVTATPNPVCIGNTLSLTSGFNSGGSGVTSYVWTGPNGFSSTSENGTLTNATSDAAGTYSVTVVDNHGCHGSGSTFNVSVVTNTANLNVSGDVSICSGSSASLSASGCSTYDWNPSTALSPTSGSNVTANPTATTTYVVTGHVGNCLNSKNITVSVLPEYSVAVTQPSFGTITPTSTNICSGIDQTYTVTPNSGYHITAVYVDGVSMGNTPPFIIHSVSAPHSISATITPDCTTPSITSATGGSVCGSGSVTLSATASAGTLNWYTSSTGGTAVATGGTYAPNVSATTTYYVDATDGTCVSARTAVTATVNSNPSASASATNVSCYGGNNGAVTVTGSGGSGTYTVSGAATTGLTAGTYNYTVTDGNGCTTTASATVTQPSSSVSASASATDVTCYGGNNGAVTVTASGGTGSLSVSGAATSSLTAGTYNYTVTDANGCTATTSATVNQPSSAVSASASVTNVSCYGGNNGAVTVTGAGGTGAYTVSGSATSALAAGTYNYTVTDANGCTATTSATVTQPSSAVSASASATDVSCYGGNSGAVTVTGTGGTGTYTVSGSATSALTAGTYNYTVTDANGCTATTSATVNQPSSAVSASASATDVSCYGGNNGAVTVTGAGGTGTYTVSGSATSGLIAGTYNYTVTDANGCTATTSATVNQPSSAVSASTSVTNVSCYGGNNGAVTVTGAGGTGTYTVSGSGTSALAAGTYNYTVTDANGCTATTSATVNQPSSAVSASASVTNVGCYGGNNGAVTVTGTGGTSPYTGTGVFSNNTAGTYNYTVTDANGCTASTSATVSQPSTALSASASVTNVSCYGGNNGSVIVTATGGTSPYTGTGTFSNKTAGTYSYTVTDANGCTASVSATVTQPSSALSASASVTNVNCNGGSTGSVIVSATGGTPSYTGTGTFSSKAAGTYSYTVTDANGCATSVSATVTQPSALSVTGTISNVLCNGQSNGSITTSVSGGTSGYTYLWNNGATTSNVSSQPAGNYSVTVTDAHSCTATTSFTITQPSAVTSTITGSNSVLGGVTNMYTGPSGMSSYSWSVTGTGASISGSSTGSSANISTVCSATNYTVSLTVANSSGCSNTATMPVSVTASATVTIYSTFYNTGSGYHPSTLKSPLTSNIKVFDRHAVGTRDWSQSHYSSVWNSTTGIISNVSISDPVSVKIGGGYTNKYTVTVPADGHYLIIGKSTVSSSAYSGGSCSVYTGTKVGDYDSIDGEDHEDDDADGGCSSSITRYHAILQDNRGRCSEGYTQEQHGSLMLMVSPAALDYTDTVALLPVVYESVEGSWDVSATAAPPYGFYATPNDSLATSVSDSEINAVQFSITDTGSEWTNTKITHNIFHKGAARVAYSNPKMINDRTNKPSALTVSPNPATDEVNVVLEKFEGKATINIYNLLGQKVAEKAINISGPTPISMDVSSLAPGVYMVTAENSYGKATSRLIKSAK